MVVDLTNYKDRVGSRVPPGRYRVVVDDVEPDRSSAGNPMINLWLRIQGGEFDGQTLVDRLTITEKSLFRVVGFMQAIGLPTPKKKLQIQPRKFVGQKLDVDVDDGEPYNGRIKSEVRGYVRIPKSQQASVEEGDGLDEFSQSTSNPSAEPEAPEQAQANESAPATPTDNASATSDDGEVDLDAIDL